MPNSRRFLLPDVPQHVVQRGNNRQCCFRTEADYSEYLLRLAVASRKYGVAIHAYTLMPNHVHLLATPTSGDAVAKLMQAVASGYVRTFNARHGRTGTLWDGRYYSSLVGSDAYLWNCHRYIELNPVRAGIADRPSNYAWSSYACNAFGRPDPVVTPHPAYLALAPDASEAHAVYRMFFAQELQESTLTEIRSRPRQERAFGDDAFLARVEGLASRSPWSRRPGRPRCADARAGGAEEITTSDLLTNQ